MSEYFGLMLPKDFFSHSTGESNPWNSKLMLKSWGAEYLVFVSSCSLKTREKYTNWDNLVCLSLYIFFEGNVFTFQFLNDESAKWIYLKSKHTSIKKHTNWTKLSCLNLYIFWGKFVNFSILNDESAKWIFFWLQLIISQNPF